jgi:hypothetical protein
LKKDSKKRARVFYDHKWLGDLRPALYAPLLRPVYAFNRRVYNELASSPPRNIAQDLAPFESGFATRPLTAGK